MQEIENIIKQEQTSIEKLVYCFELIRINKDIGIIKFDGGRTLNYYTVIITYNEGRKDMIRVDESNLKDALIKALSLYVAS